MVGKNIILCDLDGTLADASHRLHHINKTKPCKACNGRKWVETTGPVQLWIVTGRSDEVADETIAWLNDHVGHIDRLIMRKAGDHTPDHQLKKSWLQDGTIPKERVFCVFEDRSSVVKMWRSEGLVCYQVADGDF
jgi:hypothetical protein